MSPAQQHLLDQQAAAKQQAAAEARLQQERAQAQVETEARVRDLAALIAQPAFQRQMLGAQGYLGAAEAEALELLADAALTPLNDPVKMAVHLDRWRTLKTMRSDLAALPEQVQSAPPAV